MQMMIPIFTPLNRKLQFQQADVQKIGTGLGLTCSCVCVCVDVDSVTFYNKESEEWLRVWFRSDTRYLAVLYKSAFNQKRRGPGSEKLLCKYACFLSWAESDCDVAWTSMNVKMKAEKEMLGIEYEETLWVISTVESVYYLDADGTMLRC